MNTFLQDARYSLRVLRKAPGFTAVIVLTLGLGIGANTAIFSVINCVLLKPLPFSSPDQIVSLFETESAEGQFPLTGQDFLDWRQDNQTFADMSVYSQRQPANASGAGETEEVNIAATQANFFSLLGVRPLLGRAFVVGEDTEANRHVAILSYAFWQTHFGGARDATSKSVVLNGESFTVIGVMPAWYRTPGAADIWTPIDMAPKKLGPRGEHYLRAIGRLKPGVTLAQARADLKAVSARYEKQFPDSNKNVSAIVIPLREVLVGDSSSQLWTMFGAVALVLLIACANVANLVLARSTQRQREMALRGAIGATRMRLVRQLLTESVIVSLAGGALGVVLAFIGVSVLRDAQGFDVTQPTPIRIDAMALAFSVAVSVIVGLLFGLAPALQTSDLNLSDWLKSKGTGALGTGGRGRYLRDVLVAGEIALSLTLLIGAGLLLRTFAKLRAVDMGVRGDNVLTAEVNLPAAKYKTIDQCDEFTEQLVASLRAAPEIQSASISTSLPPETGSNGYVQVEGTAMGEMEGPLVAWNYVTPDYFHTMGISLLQGRVFTKEEMERESVIQRAAYALKDDETKLRDVMKHTERPVMINDVMARRFWPGENPIGKGFQHEGMQRIIGVVAAAKNTGLRGQTMSEAYFPVPETFWGESGFGFIVEVQTAGPPSGAAAILREKMKQMDGALVVYHLRTLPDLIAADMADTSYQTMLLGAMAALAMLLAAVGTYGVMSYAVGQRTNEIGIRVALGAQQQNILAMVLRQGMVLVAAGIGVGLIVAFSAARVMREMLFGVAPTDAVTYLGVSLLLAAVAFAACYIPARRAMRVDPMEALRYE
jgi:putative ABC transport system permease protein